mmetsp:Transcript_43503/g.93169  ORF Transcript_43503/g.93169 Transcript_43503/m.93169 type:complete len:358 (-) Transcript_43503:24-1097(-)
MSRPLAASPKQAANQVAQPASPSHKNATGTESVDSDPASCAPTPSTVFREETLLSTGARSLAGEATEDLMSVGSDVWVHIYHCDPYTSFLNRTILDQTHGIYHAGVEVYREEWSFQYYEDTWEDPSISGLVRCSPRRMPDYQYVESSYMGRTSLAVPEVEKLLLRLHDDWPASSYHLTHRNCLSFAEEFCTALNVPREFPEKLKGIINASKRNPNVDAAVDYTWSLMKWWMIRNNPRPEPLVSRAVTGQTDQWTVAATSVCESSLKRDDTDSPTAAAATAGGCVSLFCCPAYRGPSCIPVTLTDSLDDDLTRSRGGADSVNLADHSMEAAVFPVSPEFPVVPRGQEPLPITSDDAPF